MRYSINADDPDCPSDTPCSITNTDTGEIVACHRSLVDAAMHLRLLESDAAGRSDADRIDIGDLDDPDEDDHDDDDEDDDPEYCPLCGSGDHGEDGHPDDDDDDDLDDIGEGPSGLRGLDPHHRAIKAELIRLGAPPRERRRW